MIELAAPLALLLAPLPLLLRLLPPRPAEGEAMALPESLAAEAAPAGVSPRRRRGLALLWLSWLGLCLAFAQPQRIVLAPDRSASGRDILLALDMSGSMEIRDFALDGETVARLEAVKRVAASFIRQRTGDRVGLVLFGDRALVAAPPTHDLAAVVRALEEASIGLVGRSTAISDGLGLALKRILAEPSESKAVVLLSDGRDTTGRLEPERVALLAAERGVRVHTVALGPEDLESRPAARDAVDVASLRTIAEASGGESFRVRSLEDLKAMAEELDRLEPNPSARPPVAEARPLWIWPAAAAFLFLFGAGLGRAE